MPRMTREESRLQTREKLMLAAAMMFAREGLGGASIDRIAEEAGFTKGAFYSNFDSKEDIFLQLIEATARQNIERIETALAGVSDPDEIIEAVCT
jgi:AcrR family transcriptional regulator